MAKQIAGVYDAVLACAKEEILDKGDRDASVRVIAQRAGTSTGSIYTRFKDKEGLFEALVQPVVDGLMGMFRSIQERFHELDAQRQRERVNKNSSNEMEIVLDYMYAHFDVFRLLLDASHGTRFHDFVDRLVSMEEEYTWKWIEATGSRLEPEGELTTEFYHMMVTAYFEGIFEVVRHGMGLDDAKKYVAMMGKYHHAGFLAIVGEQAPEN